MKEKDILNRLEKLEKAVFGSTQSYSGEAHAEDTFEKISTKIVNLLNTLKQNFKENDRIIFQAILTNKSTAELSLTSLNTLYSEENDEDIAKLCSALSSKQRLTILKHLCKEKLTNGELSSITGMNGGHLYHHIKDLLALDFIRKDSSGKYSATDFGVNAYITAASLHRRLSYDDRKGFKTKLQDI